jgi:hypothetical protein
LASTWSERKSALVVGLFDLGGVPALTPRLSEEWGNSAAIDQLRIANPLDGFADGEGPWSTRDGGDNGQRQTTVAGITDAVASDVAPTRAGCTRWCRAPIPKLIGVFVMIARF